MADRMVLKTPYSAYENRADVKEDTELTHVGPGTPGGEYLRRFWQPIAFVADLADRPKRIRILGEDLVLFRDGRGRYGVLQLYCSHRGASLEFGIVSECGLRCCYHGWLYDVDGRILETPAEAPEVVLRHGMHHGAYPTHTYKGIVFAYMGPPGTMPHFPIYDVCELDGYRYELTSWTWPANWVQIRENAMDPAHTYFLHTTVSGAQFTRHFAAIPEHDFHETPHGMVYVANRRVDDFVWTRICEVMLPNIHALPSNWNEVNAERIRIPPFLFDWAVPLDDTHTMIIGFYVQPEGSEVDAKKLLEEVPGQLPNRSYIERQKQPGDYEAQVLGRPISVHAKEFLGPSDRGVVMFRKLLRQQIRALLAGDEKKQKLKRPTGLIQTYAQDTILRIPKQASDEKEDRKRLREIGRGVLWGDSSATRQDIGLQQEVDSHS